MDEQLLEGEKEEEEKSMSKIFVWVGISQI
jgi:hypothetical protein